MAVIDVIVPCYGYGHLLADCVTSVLGQSVRDLRVLIIDDASPDDTAVVAAELARKDDRVTVLRHPVNRGHIATYNDGLAWASADYALLLSADDLILPGALARAAALLDANPDVGFAYGPFTELQPGQAAADIMNAPPAAPGWTIMSGEAFFRANQFSNPVGTCTAVVRTALQKRIGFYRPELPHAGDMEMWLRFAANGPVGYVHAHQGVYRRHAQNMSTAYVKNLMLDLRQRKQALDFVFDTYGKQIDTSGELRRLLYGGLAKSAVSWASQPFIRADMTQFSEILDYARHLDPSVSRSFAWQAQMTKRFIGPRLWSALSPARNLVHSMSRFAARQSRTI